MSGLPVVPMVALGLLFFASPLIILVLILVLLSLRSRVRRLEARLGDLERRAGAPRSAAVPAAGAVQTVEPLVPSPAVPDAQETLPGFDAGPSTMTPEVSGPRSVAGELAAGSVPPAEAEAPPVPPSAPEPEPGSGVRQWEGRLGGTWLSRVGAVLLFLGVGFFLKHAFEQEWVGVRSRVLAGLVAGAAMAAVGVRLAGGATYRLPAQSLVAVGIGVIYLSLYAAHASYGLVGAPVAFVAMALATAVGFATALRLDSRPWRSSQPWAGS